MNAVVDEDLPRSFATVLSNVGFIPFDVRDYLRGSPDSKVFEFAQKQNAILFSGDLGFSNTLTFPLGTHHGICILRFPNEMSVKEVNKMAERLLSQLSADNYTGNLIIISPGRLRIRRHEKKH